MELGKHAARRGEPKRRRPCRAQSNNNALKAVSRGTATLPKHLLPFPSEATLSILHANIDSCAKSLNNTLRALDLQWQYKPPLAIGIGFAKGNVWSRAARRKMEKSPTHSYQAASLEEPEEDAMDEDAPAFGFKVHLKSGDNGVVEVAVRWLQGRDSVLFESFCGMLKRQLTAP